ncbi:transferase family protein [Arabidopsis lyrata subsp. lyrata]|uniref:Transferase family protein n=1 Tax=Arabidopsis lyrata subsp. lyrata TaxID=81972 RepID=D7LX18_ARALL|nr:transferase family protein [Arabidopsis lyrata subsp. lyrata]
MSGLLTFTVHRKKPELVSPVKPTPRELKLLSDIDDQEGLRFHIPTIFFYRHNPTAYSDPTLVYYYPFAGRLREGQNRKLAVDCTGEGVLFIEADADVTLVEFEEKDALKPPFPCFEELLFDIQGSSEMLNTPLMLMQVTRLKCGGFVFAVRINHVMSDAAGLKLFLKTMCEFVRGYHAPTVASVWERHLLNACVPVRVTHMHREYDEMPAIGRSFFFGHGEMSAIRRLLPPNIVNSSTNMETLTSFLWRYRTVALQPDPDKEMRLIFIVNGRSKLKNPPLPPGYYGNAFATTRELSNELRNQAKLSVTEEYMRSLADLMVIKGRPSFLSDGAYLVSDVRIFADIDFKIWGKPVYGGIGTAGVQDFPGASFYVSTEKRNGEIGIIVPVCLPEKAMRMFVEELEGVFNGQFVFNRGSKKL